MILCHSFPFQNGRWDGLLYDCKTKEGTRKVGSVKFNKHCKLATGSFGAQIYVGYRGSQEVAVKRVCTEFIQGELKVINSLKGRTLKNVLQPVCCFSDDDFTYITTPLCEYNLEELIEDKSCPLRQALEEKERMLMCSQFLEGLKELHDNSILHRDLKPSNVLLGKENSGNSGNLF